MACKVKCLKKFQIIKRSITSLTTGNESELRFIRFSCHLFKTFVKKDYKLEQNHLFKILLGQCSVDKINFASIEL